MSSRSTKSVELVTKI